MHRRSRENLQVPPQIVIALFNSRKTFRPKNFFTFPLVGFLDQIIDRRRNAEKDEETSPPHEGFRQSQHLSEANKEPGESKGR